MQNDNTKLPVIGVTIFPPKTGFSVWSNGAHANCFFLALLFHAAGFRCYLINGGDGDSPPAGTLPEILQPIPFVRMDEVIGELDVLIQSGAQIEAAHAEKVHARGGKVIAYKFGNDHAIDAERAIHNLPAGSIYNGTRFDEVWTTTQHEETCAAYWELTYRCPLRILPHIWHSCFVDQIVSQMPSGMVAGYQPGREKKRIAIFEPNINWVKSCHVPMLVAEAAFRSHPELIESVLVCNSEHMKNRLPFSTFATNLDICKAKSSDGHPICSFEGRWNTPYFMANHADIAISHQWLPSPNYLAYDLLHLGYPLVHNVSGMPGYFYPRFDARLGGKTLVDALTRHEDRLGLYRYEADSFLENRRATSDRNIRAHAWALQEVCR